MTQLKVYRPSPEAIAVLNRPYFAIYTFEGESRVGRLQVKLHGGTAAEAEHYCESQRETGRYTDVRARQIDGRKDAPTTIRK
jgi:hypothetical protein